MRTPDEIKKGLECRSRHLGEECSMECKSCDVYVSGRFSEIFRDAIIYINHLEQRLAQAERERDAMLLDMQRYSMCGACKHFVDGKKCPMYDDCDYAKVGHFEWRGVCEENSKEEQQ